MWRSGLDRLLTAVAGAVFPGRCPGCGAAAEPVCAACLADVPPVPDAPPPPGVDRWAAAFAYDGVARELVAGAKYRGEHATIRWLADRMVVAWHAAAAPCPDLVTWVPTASGRRRARGFDHARVLAQHTARGLGVQSRALLLRGPGPPQTERSLHDRRGGPVVGARRRVDGAVLVVDDVTTTGASLRVCAATLRAAGAREVMALTAARTAADRRARVVSAPAPCASDARGSSRRRRDENRIS